LHYTFGAMGDDELALIALANRFYNGISVENNCEKTLKHYRTAADLSIFTFLVSVRMN
jgi:hypothetical protein